MENKELFLFICQACINSYGGRWGEPRPIFDKEIPFDFGFFGYKNDNLYIVFQGSIGIRDWLDNFKFSKQEFNGYVHRGFLHQYRLYRDIILQNVDNKNVITVGHSLGAAMATLCNIDLKYQNLNVSSYTIGSPRVGNSDFVKLHDSLIPTIRIVNADDIVPNFPNEFMNYKHVGKEIRIGNRKWYKIFSIADHDPRNYLKSLSKL